MNKLNELKDFRWLVQLNTLFQGVKQLSWTFDQTSKRYPTPEALTALELRQLVKTYLALGFDIEELHKKWKKLYTEYKNEVS